MFIDRLTTHLCLCGALITTTVGTVLLFRLDYRQPSWFFPAVVAGAMLAYLIAAISFDEWRGK